MLGKSVLMRTHWKTADDPQIPPLGDKLLRAAAACLESGGIALLPAEGLYGLHVCVGSESSGLVAARVDRLRAIKGDPPGRPYILLIGAPEGVNRLAAQLPLGAPELIAEAWPGPLTLILPAAAGLHPDLVKAGRVAVRCPGNRLLRELALRLPGPLLTTSANRAGEAAPAAMTEVSPEVMVACDLAVDQGRLAGRGSTLAEIGPDGRPVILRPGLWPPGTAPAAPANER